MPSNPKNIGIIVSSGRTGTNFLAEYFDKNFDDVTALHEPKPSYALRRYSNAYLSGKISDEKMAAVLQRKRKKLMASIETSTYIESNPYLHGFLPVLDSVWTDPKVIHIVRDPRTYVVSGVNHQDARAFKKLANQLIPNWVPNVKRLLNMSDELTSICFFAGYWRVINESIQHAGQHRKQYKCFHYESLFEEGFSELHQISDLFSLDITASKEIVSPKTRINKSVSQKASDWSTWTPVQCAQIHQICSPLMQEYGYGMDEAWLERVEEGMA